LKNIILPFMVNTTRTRK